jgi:hypothetical protein
MLRMALATALRLKELTTLQWANIDLAAGVLYVDADGKTGREDSVPLTEEARAVLKGIPRQIGSPYVFHDEKGQTWNTDKARNRISYTTLYVMGRAGIAGASFHTLRHTCASWMVQAGVDLYRVKEFMRHSSIVQTERYAHLGTGAPDRRGGGLEPDDFRGSCWRNFGDPKQSRVENQAISRSQTLPQRMREKQRPQRERVKKCRILLPHEVRRSGRLM